MNRKRLWLHCTQDDHGPRFTARRIVPPRYAATECNEPKIPRLCVCPTLAGCFAAQFFYTQKPVQVYRTVLPRSGIFPGRKRVWDCIITREHWLVPPVELEKVEVIPYEKFEDIAYPRFLYYKLTGPNSKFRIRVAEYVLAAKVLGEKSLDKKILDYYRRYISTKHPADYIIDEADRECEEKDRKEAQKLAELAGAQ